MSEDHDEPQQQTGFGRSSWRRALGVVAVLAGLSVLGWLIVYPQISNYRHRRVLRTAGAFLQAQDYRSAYLVLDQWVADNPGDFEARRRLAKVLDVYGARSALREWETLSTLEPGNAANFSGLAAAALHEGQLDKLAQALAELRRLDPSSLDLLRLTAAEALARGDWSTLRPAIETLAKAEPDNETTQFDLATLKLGAGVPKEMDEARLELTRFARSERLRIRATLALLADAQKRWGGNEATQLLLLARDLELRPGGLGQSLAGNRGKLAEPGLPELTEYLKNQPAPGAEDAARLALWMIKLGQARDALDWLESRDENLKQAPPVLGAMATCALVLESWPKLEALLLQNAWGPIPVDSVRYAFEARTLREAGGDSRAERLWGNAILSSEHLQSGLRTLQRLAQAWHWPAAKQIQVLWTLTRQFPSDTLAWQKLSEQVLSTKDSGQIWRVYTAWAQAAPENLQVQAQRVVLGLLVRPNETGLTRQAAELFQRQPRDPAVRLARALAFWREGKNDEALAASDPVGIDPTREPRLALARGLVLASLGRREQSEEMLRLVPVEILLPEEKALIQAARQPAR